MSEEFNWEEIKDIYERDQENHRKKDKVNNLRRFRDEIIEALKKEEDKRSDRAVGSLKFTSGDLAKTVGTENRNLAKPLSLLNDELSYMEKFSSKYEIDPDDIDQLEYDLEPVEDLPTFQEEIDEIKHIIQDSDQGKLRMSEVVDRFNSRYDFECSYELTKNAFTKRVDKCSDIKSEKTPGRINLYYVDGDTLSKDASMAQLG